MVDVPEGVGTEHVGDVGIRSIPPTDIEGNLLKKNGAYTTLWLNLKGRMQHLQETGTLQQGHGGKELKNITAVAYALAEECEKLHLRITMLEAEVKKHHG